MAGGIVAGDDLLLAIPHGTPAHRKESQCFWLLPFSQRAKTAALGVRGPGLLLHLRFILLFIGAGVLRAQTSNIPAFRISGIQVSGGIANLNINSATGYAYTLEGKEASQGYWDELASQSGNGGSLAFSVPIADSSTAYFYRIAAVSSAMQEINVTAPGHT